MKRRTILATAAAATAIPAAGCTGSDSMDSSGGSTTTETTTETPTATPTPEPPAFELVSLDVPSSVETGEEVQIEFTARNTGERDGTLTTELIFEDDTGSQNSGDVSLDIPGGQTETWTSSTTTFNQAGTLYVRLPEFGAEAEMEIEAASTAPEILQANLVSSWEQYGDVIDNRIDSARAGVAIQVGFRHRYYVHEGSFHIFEQAEIYDDDENRRVGIQTYENEQIFDQNGYTTFEHTLAFDTRGWGPGTYRASVRIRDQVTNEVSDAYEFTFELE